MLLAAAESPKLLFVTASAPMTEREEAFVQDELSAMLGRGVTFCVAPTRRHLARPNLTAIRSGLAERTIHRRLLAPSVLCAAVVQFATRPISVARLLARVVAQAGGLRNATTNVLSFPKALWLARLVRKEGISHVHAYWLAHTATVAMIAAELGSCTWSASGFRWDIDANNCLSEKLRRASFLRVADEFGLELVSARAKVEGSDVPIVLIRTGVAMQSDASVDWPPVLPEFCCAGAFVEKKAQGIVLDAFALVRPAFANSRLHFFGDGELRAQIEQRTSMLQLGDAVEFHGTVPLEELRRFLRRRPITLLPSIITPGGEQEGIPVVLIEAMANGSPVVSTDTGAIAHLITEGCGTLVEPGSATSLATAMRAALERKPGDLDAQCANARSRVLSEFSLAETSRALLERCLSYSLLDGGAGPPGARGGSSADRR